MSRDREGRRSDITDAVVAGFRGNSGRFCFWMMVGGALLLAGAGGGGIDWYW